MATINPLDEAAILAAAAETGAIVTVEEASVRGGLGGAVAELTSANHPVPVERLGFPGFVPTGSVEWLFHEFGLSTEGIAAAARRALGDPLYPDDPATLDPRAARVQLVAQRNAVAEGGCAVAEPRLQAIVAGLARGGGA